MKSVYQTIGVVLVALLIMLFGESCSDYPESRSEKRIRMRKSNDTTTVETLVKVSSDSLAFRAKILISDTTSGTFLSSYVEIIKVPRGYQSGDTVMLYGTNTHVLGSRVMP